MKKIILILIISLFFVNFSSANDENCLIETDKDYWEKSEKFKNCEESEKIIDLKEDENWNFIYISKIENENDFKIKINHNSKTIFEKKFSKKENEKLTFLNKIAFSKYKNHNLVLLNIWKYEYWEYYEDQKFYEKYFTEINWIYLDWKLISKNIEIINFLEIAWELDFPLEIKFKEQKEKYLDITKNLKLFLDDEEYLNLDFNNKYTKEEFQKIFEISKYLKGKSFINENKKYFLSKFQREKIDNSLKKFLENKENISKIDEIIKKIKDKQYLYIKNSVVFETYDYLKSEIFDYLKSELKIFKLKNS